MKKILKWLAPLAIGIAAITSAYGLVTLPYTFTAGTAIEAAKVNANDQALRDGINTHLAATNPHNTTLAQILAIGNTAGVNAINFNNVASQNFLVQNVTVDPSCAGGTTGKLIYNTIDGLFKVCNGTSFVSIAGTGVNTLASVLSAGNSASTFNIDLNSNQLLNARVENRTTDGASVLAGRVFIRTDTGDFKVCNGTSCTALGGAQGLASTLGISNSAGSTNIDFNGNQAVKLRMEVLASDPATVYSGRVYYNSVSNLLKFYDAGSSTWKSIGNNQGLSDVLAISNSAGTLNLDMNLHQLLNARVENLSGSPGTGNAGRMYYDTTATKLVYAESGTNRNVVAEDKTQTLTNKSISGSSNTFTNVPDSALSANVLLADGVQTVTGKKSFNTGKISVADISTPSGAKHILTDGLADDTITLNNAVQTLNGKTMGAFSATGNVNLTEHQLINTRVENRGADPAPGNPGRIFYKTATGEMAYDDGTNIKVLTANTTTGTPWKLGGNSLIDDTADFFGTTDAEDVVMISNNVNLLKLTKTGTVITPTLVSGLLHADVGGLLSSSTVVNADINAAAAIARTKIASGTNYRLLANSATGVMSENAAITGNKAVASDVNGQLVASATTDTELGYVSGVTSAIQTQLGNKQGLDATLTSLAAYNTNGILTQTAADTFTGRTITGTANAIAVSNGDGVAGNPTLSISSNAALPGSPTTTTQSQADNSTKIATTAYVDTLGATKQGLDATLTSLAAFNTNGLLTQTAADTFTGRTLTGTANTITVTNGDGVLGNPTLTIASNAVLPGTGSVTLPTGTTAQRSGSPVNGMIRYNTDLATFEGYTTAWGAIAGSGGGTNFIGSSDGSTTTGWATFADAAATSPADGTGGSPSSTLTSSASSPLIGSSSFLWTKSANNRQGEGFSYDFTIDAAYKSKPMTISSYFNVASGTFADNDFSIWIYDVTNSVLIQPSSYLIKNAVGAYQLKSEFQSNSNSTSYRLIYYTGSTSALAYSLQFDAVSVSPNTYNTGSSTTAWVAYTPTYVGFGTVSTSAMFWRRVGDNIEISGRFTGGTVTGSTATVSLPSGLTSADTSKLYNGTQVVGVAQINTNVANTSYDVLISPSATSMQFSVIAGNNASAVYGIAGLTALGGSTVMANGNDLSLNARFPIAGWSTAQVLSSDTDTRVIAMAATGSPANSTAGNPIIYPTITKDTHGAYNASTGQYTAPVSGFYAVTGTANCTYAVNNDIYVYVNGSNYQTLAHEFTANAQLIGSAQAVYALAGQTIDIRASANLSGCGTSWFNVARVSGPEQVAASETVKASYYQSAASNTPGAAGQINYDTKIYDSHGAVTTGAGAWKFTAPISGTYHVTANTFANYVTYITIYKNGSKLRYVAQNSGTIADTTGAADVQLLAGDYLDVRTDSSGTVTGGSPSAGSTEVDIIRVGNY